MSEPSPDRDEKCRRSTRQPFVDPGDLAVSALLIAGAGYLYYLTTRFEEPSALLGQNVGPADFPRLVIYTIVVLALIMPFERRFQPERWLKIRKERAMPVQLRAWITIGFLIATIFVAPYLGTILTMLFVSLTLPLLWGERRLFLVIPFAVLFTFAVTWLFNIVLKVYFEPGAFGVTAKLFSSF
jgi:putative tricarboxylic transport membrane protein